jgi:hypothetical protein
MPKNFRSIGVSFGLFSQLYERKFSYCQNLANLFRLDDDQVTPATFSANTFSGNAAIVFGLAADDDRLWRTTVWASDRDDEKNLSFGPFFSHGFAPNGTVRPVNL